MISVEHAMMVDGAFGSGAVSNTLSQAPLTEERLPFTVKIVRDNEALRKAVAIRQTAYARHMPELAEKLRAPEALDLDQDSVVLLAESKLDGSPVGSMRIQTNRRKPLSIEQGVTLPEWLRGKSLAEATRLGVDLGRTGRVVKLMMCKAFYLYSLETGIEWMVIGARPPVDRQYEAALFTDIFPGEIIPMRHFNNIPHRVLGLDVEAAARIWASASHPLHKLMNKTRHPDIDVGDADLSARGNAARSTILSNRVAIPA
jgi:hypothetical protein